jgi:hypothetical protein
LNIKDKDAGLSFAEIRGHLDKAVLHKYRKNMIGDAKRRMLFHSVGIMQNKFFVIRQR